MINSYDLEKLIRKHKEKRPQMTAQDVYKLLYQGVFGPLHFIEDSNEVRRDLEKEISAFSFFEEELIEPLNTGDTPIRVNLRPYIQQGLIIPTLSDIFVFSTKQTYGNMQDFVDSWSAFEGLVKAGKLDFNRASTVRYGDFMAERNYPMEHHSDNYLKTYKPAYRVVDRELLDRAFENPIVRCALFHHSR